MVNTYLYTKIKLNICYTPCINVDQNMTSFQSYGVMLHTMSVAVPENGFYFFTRFKLDPPYNADLISRPVTLILFLKEQLAGRKFTRNRDLSKAVCHFRAQRYTCFGVPICSSEVAEAARNVCGQWRNALWMFAEVWWRYVHWFPLYITCDRTHGLAQQVDVR